MDTQLVIAIIGGAILVILSILSQVALWQRKEYRWDRLWAYIHSPEWYVVNGWLLIGLALSLDVGWLAYIAHASKVAEIAGWAALAVLAVHHGWRIYRRGVYRPRMTIKAKMIIAATATVAFAYVWGLINTFEVIALQLATLVAAVPVLTTLTVTAINLITDWRRREIIEQAKKLRASLSDLTVVGITGSFGKTSTKHFLDEILTVAGRPHEISSEHRNEELAVAQDMLHKLTKSFDIYVAEMGAYRLGEVEKLVQLCRPQIGIVTAIGNQHLAIFGSLRNLARAKWELIKGLPADGVAVLNADDPTIVKLGKKITKKVIWYSAKKRADVYATDIVVGAKSLNFTLHIGKTKQALVIPLIGVVLDSILAAVAAANALGVSDDDIFTALKKLTPMPRTMELCTGLKSSTVIDDSYSANEAGVIGAIKHLDNFVDQPKVIVMTPLIELGREASAVHCRIGEALARSDAEVFITGLTHKSDLRKGAGVKNAKRLHFINQPERLLATVSSVIKSDSIVLLEGRIPDVIRKGLRK